MEIVEDLDHSHSLSDEKTYLQSFRKGIECHENKESWEQQHAEAVEDHVHETVAGTRWCQYLIKFIFIFDVSFRKILDKWIQEIVYLYNPGIV